MKSRAISLATAAMLAACAQQGAKADAPPASLEGAWRVEDIDHGGVVDDALATIEFGADGRLSGRGGCNRFGGDYSYRNGRLSVGALFSTKMACAPALMDLEAKILNRLEGELTAAVETGGAVSLSDAEGRILIRRDEGARGQ
jgi:putative lipoprotein